MSTGTIDLNCDLGERDDEPGIAGDRALLKIVSSANIACGGHAGNEQSMTRTVRAAMDRGGALGAHPGYPDRQNFGRVSFAMSALDLESSISGQVDALLRIIVRHGGELTHVKLHGSLYHSAMRQLEVAEAVARGVARVDRCVILIGQAGAPALDVWRGLGFRVAAEAFADRRYEANGSLRARQEVDAVIQDPQQTADQAVRIASGLGAVTLSGEQVAIQAETIGLHSDTPNAVAIAQSVHDTLEHAGILLRALRK